VSFMHLVHLIINLIRTLCEDLYLDLKVCKTLKIFKIIQLHTELR